MTANDLLSEMQGLGFSEYEARAYVTLLERGQLTGYQLAKATGIPRPNIYPVLDRLQVRGVAARIDVKGGTRYVALPAEAMLDRIGREMSGRLERAKEALRGVQETPSSEVVWNVEGYEAVMNRALALVDHAREQILVGNWSREASALSAAMSAATARGVRVTTLCIQGCPEECGGCRGEIYRYPVVPEQKGRWLVLSVDDEELLVAEMTPDGDARAAVTRLNVLVSLAGHYLRNAIAAAEIARSLGPRMMEMLDAGARSALQGAGLATGGAPWIARILKVVGRAP